MDAINYIEKLKMETTDALEEKIYKDYKDDDRLSTYSEPEMWTQDHS